MKEIIKMISCIVATLVCGYAALNAGYEEGETRAKYLAVAILGNVLNACIQLGSW